MVQDLLLKGAKMPKYIAKQSIGHFMPGDEIKGLNDERIQALLASGAIEEEKAPEQPKDDGTAAQLATLEAEIAVLKVNESKLLEEKAKADSEIAGLKAKVEGLENSLNTSEAALKKATTESKKTTTPTEK